MTRKQILSLLFSFMFPIYLFAQPASQSIDSLRKYVSDHPQDPVIVSTSTPLITTAGTIVDYLPHRAYRVILNGTVPNNLVNNFLSWSTDTLSKYNTRAYSQSYIIDTPRKVLIFFFPNVRDSVARKLIKDNGISDSEITTENDGYSVIINHAQFDNIKGDKRVRFMEFVVKNTPLTHIGNLQAINTGNARRAIKTNGRALNGDSIIIGLGDFGPISHIDIKEKIVATTFMSPNNHGPHVMGTIAGSGHVDEYCRGYAPKARIYYYPGQSIQSYMPSLYSSAGLSLTNNSYTTASELTYGAYTGTSRKMDSFAITMPKLLNVFASGNSGMDPSFYAPAGYGNMTGNQERIYCL